MDALTVMADPVEEAPQEVAGLVVVSGEEERVAGIIADGACVGIEGPVRGDGGAVLGKERLVDIRVPHCALQSHGPLVDIVSEVVVPEITEAEEALETVGGIAVLAGEDTVDDTRHLLRHFHAFLVAEQSERLEILPVLIVDVGHAGPRDGAPEVVRVDFAQQGNKGTRVRSSVGDVGSFVRGQVILLEPRVANVAGKVNGVGKGLLCGEEAHVLGREVGNGIARAIVAVLEDDGKTTSGLGENLSDALLKV